MLWIRSVAGRLPFKVPTSTSGAVWGSVSCPMTLWYADQGNRTSNQQDPNSTPDPQLPKILLGVKPTIQQDSLAGYNILKYKLFCDHFSNSFTIWFVGRHQQVICTDTITCCRGHQHGARGHQVAPKDHMSSPQACSKNENWILILSVSHLVKSLLIIIVRNH